MRRQEREIQVYDQMLEIVKACDCCRIGLVDAVGDAYIVPMNFGYETVDETLTLYFHSAGAGKKADLLAKQPRITFEMDTGHALVTGGLPCQYSYLYQCVMGKGTVRILQESEHKAAALQKIMQHYTGDSDRVWEFPDLMLNKVMVFQLTVTQWSCKAHVQPK